MIFNELTVYHAPEFLFSLEQLNDALTQFKSKPISDDATHSVGFINPISSAREDLALQLKTMFGFRIKIQEKKVAPSKIKALADQRIEKALEENPSLSLEAKEDLSEQARNELVRLEPAKSSYVTAYIDTATDFIYVGDKSESNCNAMLGLLRKALGSFACTMVKLEMPPSVILREAVMGRSHLEKGLIAEYWSSIKAVGDKNTQVLSYKNIDLGEDELAALNHRYVTQLDMLFIAAPDEKWLFTISCKKKDHFYSLSKIKNLPSPDLSAEPLFSLSEESHNGNWLILADRLQRLTHVLNESFGGLLGEKKDGKQDKKHDAETVSILQKAASEGLPEGMTVTVTEVHNG